MITRSEGQQRVYEQVNASYRGDNGPLVIIEDLTVDREYGWVFFYDAKKYVETGDFKYAVAGNAPVLVEKQTGRLVSLGTGRPVDYYLAEYEAGRWGVPKPPRVFEVEKVKSLVGNGSRWSLTGIAYEDIEVSDVVLTETEMGQIPLVVASIRSEGQDVSTLKRTRTGDMVVIGRIGDDIHGLKYLLKGERVQP